MKRPAILFDRDNTIIVSDGYLGDPEKVVLMEGAADAVARARSMGFATVICSNQSGVARGMFDENAVNAVNRKIDQMLIAANRAAVIDRHEFCPFHPEATVDQYRQDSDLRKPKPGMILAAAEKLALDLSRSWVIGDAPRDITAGKAAGCGTILFQPQGVPASPAAQDKLSMPPDCIANTFKEAMDYIEAHQKQADANEPPSTARPEPIAPAARVSSTPPPNATTRMEHLAEQILEELRRRNQHDHFSDFSVSKLMAGIIQVISVALLLLAYLYRNDPSFQHYIFFGLFFQVLTISLLVMGKQR